ncbi:hypothetical protein A374_18099 [Fictibacillus macauensis ZFHKF-1]|uniref:O-antigen polymerase n=1 Tax=Fictibacillus macauensis ZFHKF-1 TaxID=1196324 RepID=I8UB27_9BACL|nr:hypothetical protein [Fictibacillus macauensis]EIT83973.1 hypothetical protein A374_18099 [Fictibacillus macauensis ZFHKF-1]
MNKKQKHSKYSISYIFLSLFPILSLYQMLPLVNIGYFIIFLFILLKYITREFKPSINIKLFFVLSLIIFINLIVGLLKYSNIGNTINNSAGILIFTLLAIVLCVPENLSKEKLYISSKFVGIFSTIFLFYQSINFHVFQVIVKGNLPFLTPLEDGFKSIEWGRPSAFFYEPAHYAIYIGPIFAISLIKKDYITAVLFFVGLFVSTSSTGILIAFIIPMYIYIKSVKKIFSKLFILILTAFIFFITTSLNNSLWDKVDSENLSSNIRVLGTLDYLKNFSDIEFIFGIGINRLAEFAMNHGFIAYNYANAYVYSLISFGVIGGSIWLFYNISLVKQLSREYRVLIIILICISFSDQILFNRNLLYLLIWIYTFSYTRSMSFEYSKRLVVRAGG